jgi:amino acid transporter
MMVFLLVVCAAAAWKGIELSTKVLVALGLFEIVVCVALAANGFANPGPGGVSLQWLNPGNAPSGHAFFLGIIFAVFAISGWDAAAPIAEESANPKKTVPRAVLGSIVLLGVFLVFVSWGQLTGFGTDRIGKFGADQLPAFALGHQYWHGAWIIVLLALFNSAIAVSIACTNAASRVFYSMGRSGVLPKSFAVLHPTNRTPVNAIWFQTAISTVLGLGLALAIGQANVYNVTGTMFTFALIPVYIVANIGLFVLYRRDHPNEFNWFKHAVVGIVSAVALILVGYYSLSPWPPYPINLAAPIVAGWIVLGAIVLRVMLSRGHDHWIASAGDTVAEVGVTPDEHGARVPVAR